MVLPLQVFEPRYHQLLAECLQADDPFGVVLIRRGESIGDGEVTPFLVGTTARIESVTPTGAGRVALRTVGERRFRITTLHRDRPYLSAEVEYPVDEASEVPDTLLSTVQRGYAQTERFRQLVDGVYRRDAPTPASPAALADALGAAAAGIVSPRMLQPILEADDVRQRLERAAELLGGILRGAHQQAQRAVSERWGGVDRRN